ncbi:MAG TPA: hypothetical protein VFB45_17585 [Pseudolabrys sp.]|nr:hypothetical protein [Pseudolabrys sp.]
MRIDINARPKAIEPAVNWISGLIGSQLDQLVEKYAQQERNNPLLGTYFRENFELEFALAKARKYRRSRGRLPKGQEYDHLYGFLIAAQRVHAALPPEARTPFEGRLRYALSSEHGARPLAYEISIATHLMSRGWDVDFIDYSGTGQFDFLARLGSSEIEVECKTTSGDTGRKIHRQELNRLADLLLPTTTELVEEGGSHLIRITLPGRLEKTKEIISGIASSVIDATRTRSGVSNDLSCVDYIVDDATTWPKLDDGRAVLDFFEKRFGVRNSHILFHGRPGAGIVAVMTTSAKADKVVDAIANEAKKAAKQCSGTRPAFVALHLVDKISRPELEGMLKSRNGLHAIAHETFKEGRRAHIDSIAFTLPQTSYKGAGATWLSGDVLRLDNPQPQFDCPEIRSIFQAA